MELKEEIEMMVKEYENELNNLQERVRACEKIRQITELDEMAEKLIKEYENELNNLRERIAACEQIRQIIRRIGDENLGV